MRPNRKWFYLLSMLTLLISSCQPSESVTVDQPMSAGKPPAVNALINFALQGDTATDTENNECLNCHSDKEQLIDTADPVEEIAESESKGVG